MPLDRATFDGEDLHVGFEKQLVKDAPRIDADQALSEADEDQLYRHYGLSSTTAPSSTDTYSSTGSTGTTDTYASADTTPTTDRTEFSSTGQDTSGPNTDSAMTRSEERLSVGTERVQTGKARLRKYIVTEQQTVTVPVTREEVRLEREPITDANVGDALSGPDLSEEEHEVILTEERPVVSKETVPVERVRLDTETVTEQEQVSADVRKEEIELADAPSQRH